MYSVTQRISKIKQPRGGYIKRKDFTCITLEDGIELNSQENMVLCQDLVQVKMRFSPF